MPENRLPDVCPLQDPVDLRADPAAYPSRLAALVRNSGASWIAWSGSLLQGAHRPTRTALSAMLDSVDPAIVCLAIGEDEPQQESWVTRFSSGMCVPWLWRRHVLVTLLDAARSPLPSPFYLPFQLAFAANARSLGHFACRGAGPDRSPDPWLRGRREALPHILPIVAVAVHPLGTLPRPDEPPAVSIALCAYNEADRIPWALASVFAQSDGSWELIVVDDGSTDATAATVHACSRQDPRVRILRLPLNEGKAHALNRALAVARGRFLLELDADDWLAPQAVSRMREAIADTANGAPLLTFDHFVWRSSRQGELRLCDMEPAAEPLVTRREARVPIPRLFRISALRELGGWRTTDASGGRLFEDVAITHEMQRKGTVARHPGALYHRVIRQSSISQAHRAAYRHWAHRQFLEIQQTDP